MATIPFVLEGPHGGRLHGLIDAPPGPGPWPVAVICHGFKGFQEWGFFPPLADLLAQRGFAAVRFNFTGAGMAPGDDLVTDLAAFEANHHQREKDEVIHLLDHLDDLPEAHRLDRSKIGLLGHSRGGGAAILAASDPRWAARVRALVTWASISRIDRYGDEAMETWRADGRLRVVNGRTGQELFLGTRLLTEVEEVPPDLDIENAAARRTAPWLILHGDEDEAVPVAEARRLAEVAAPTNELAILRGTGHTFGARHPFAGPTPALIEGLNRTQTWFRRHLT